MDYIRNQLYRVKNSSGAYSGGDDDHESFQEQTIVIRPGQVEIATHIVSIPGKISLEELRFWAYVPDPHDGNLEPIIEHADTTSELAEDPRSPKNHPDRVEEEQQPQQQRRSRQTNNSYIDIVVFEIPVQCSSSQQHPFCDLTSYGIGKIESLVVDENDDDKFLSLCDKTTGRLWIDQEIFRGYHTELHIPPSGILMKDRITDPRAGTIPSFPSEDAKYEVMFANCDQRAYGTGRNVGLSGQVVFESDPYLDEAIGGSENIKQLGAYNNYRSTTTTSYNSRHIHKDYNIHHVATQHQQDEYGGPPLDVTSQIKLIAMGFSVCVLFSFLSLRVHSGTMSDYFTERVNRANRILSNGSSSDDGNDAGEGNNNGHYSNSEIFIH
uniref:Uncharacterized protein n=1 Tax=Pseudo-nitzschia australis TaxID=44445 RepID=A0A7S4AY05_9STRA|mmetsp:Transcript_1705/g.3816  ORF Transcript_1705/g.3816 Transcript_1705/m.3816 type:complete len:381 (+) Transcript_1705:111-1253(+)